MPSTTSRQRRQAKRLAAMASDQHISYAVTDDMEVAKDLGCTWYSVVATAADGRTWTYWLAADYGSYRGSF